MLIVEDGTVVAGAESYISVADANTYHAARGNTNWATISEAEAEQALRRATDYLVQVYRLKWDGVRFSGAQALDWPRSFVRNKDQSFGNLYPIVGYFYYPSDYIPPELKNACAEMAFKAASGELAPDLDKTVIKEKIDVLEVEYDKNSLQYKRYRAIDNMLAPFLSSGSSGTFRRVERV